MAHGRLQVIGRQPVARLRVITELHLRSAKRRGSGRNRLVRSQRDRRAALLAERSAPDQPCAVCSKPRGTQQEWHRGTPHPQQGVSSHGLRQPFARCSFPPFSDLALRRRGSCAAVGCSEGSCAVLVHPRHSGYDPLPLFRQDTDPFQPADKTPPCARRFCCRHRRRLPLQDAVRPQHVQAGEPEPAPAPRSTRQPQLAQLEGEAVQRASSVSCFWKSRSLRRQRTKKARACSACCLRRATSGRRLNCRSLYRRGRGSEGTASCRIRMRHNAGQQDSEPLAAPLRDGHVVANRIACRTR